MFKFATAQIALGMILVCMTASVAAVSDGGGTPVPPPDRAPTMEQLQGMVEQAMPADVKADNRELLAALMKPVVAPRGPSDAFDIKSAGRLLRLSRAIPGKGCFLPPPAYNCTFSDGTRGGGGAYKELHADSLGNLRFINRLADPTKGNPEAINPPEPVLYSREDKAAIAGFADLFAKVFQVPPGEAPPPEEWKVQKLAVGVVDTEKGTPAKIQIVAGVVNVPRLLKVQGLSVPTIPVIGSGVQGSMDDLGVFRVEVDNWTRFTMPARLGQASAPSRRSLVKAISEELIHELAAMPKSIKIAIAYAKGSQFSELAISGAAEEAAAPRATATGDTLPDEHRYVPVLMTTVTPTAADANEEQQNAEFLSEAGLEMVTPLYELAD